MPGHVEPDGKGKYKIIVEAGRNPATGKRKRIVRRFRGRKTDAEELMLKLLSELQRDEYVELSRVTIEDWFTTWLDDYKKPRLRPTTYENYDIMLKTHIIPKIGALELQALRTDHLQKLYNEKAAEGLSPATVHRIHQVVHGALDQAVKNRMINKNVSKSTILPSIRKKEVPALTPKEQKKFMSALEGDRLKAAFILLMGTGIRRGELLGLKWRDVDLKNKVIIIRESLTYTKESGLTCNPPKTEKR